MDLNRIESLNCTGDVDLAGHTTVIVNNNNIFHLSRHEMALLVTSFDTSQSPGLDHLYCLRRLFISEHERQTAISKIGIMAWYGKLTIIYF